MVSSTDHVSSITPRGAILGSGRILGHLIPFPIDKRWGKELKCRGSAGEVSRSSGGPPRGGEGMMRVTMVISMDKGSVDPRLRLLSTNTVSRSKELQGETFDSSGHYAW